MIIVKIEADSNGGHFSQSWDRETMPDGFVAVPESLLDAYTAAVPFMDLTTRDGVLAGITARERPEAPAPEIAESTESVLLQLAADQEYRISALEFGLTS